MKNHILELILIFLMYAPTAMSGRCEDWATPRDFTEESAMKAIFCDYNGAHKGTLLPITYTKSWSVKQAKYLATPILAATYQENNAGKGVIAIQRQLLEDGEPWDSHGQTATISVYVFKHDGAKWVFEKGKTEAANAGTHGSAPGGELVKLGAEKYGLWFEGGWTGQGYAESYAFIVALSDPKVLEAGNFDTGRENGGTCSDDPKERGDFVHACWSYEGQPEFIKAEGGDYYILRIKYSGTEAAEDDMDKIVPKNAPVCYAKAGEKYQEIKDPKCAEYAALPKHDIFGVGEAKKEKRAAQPPRKNRQM